MRWTLLTLFPEMFGSALTSSLFGKAVEKGVLSVEVVNYRDYAAGRHKVVDDAPFGGGAGMLIKVEPVAEALDALREKHPGIQVILLSPQGEVLTQAMARRLARIPHLALLCGRYEGFDERIRSLVDAEVSVGDYVLSGGEPAAWVVMDAVSRLLPGVLGSEESIQEESFSNDCLLEYPQYTRPRVFRGQEVPEILISGDHAAVARWRRLQSLLRTFRRRPDLVARLVLSEEERAWLDEEL